MSNKIVSIIVVAAGTKSHLKSCLDSIKEQSYTSVETIVIDNSLSNDFYNEFSDSYPGARLYPGQESLSYCAALNKGIGIANGDFILCLNDDACLDKDYITEALKGFALEERIGMVSGKILRADKEMIDSTGMFLTLWRTAGERGYGAKDRGQFEKSGYIFGVNGAVAFYRRKMLEEIKIGSEYFDPLFRFFYEDLDVAWRAENLGWRGYYVPGAIAYHVRGLTARQGKGLNKGFARRYLSDDLNFDLIKNRYLTIIRNESFPGLLLHLPFILFYNAGIWSYVLFFRPQLMKKVFLLNKHILAALKKRLFHE